MQLLVNPPYNSHLFNSLFGGRQKMGISTVSARSGLRQPGRVTVVTLRPRDSGRLDMEMRETSLALLARSNVKQCHTDPACRHRSSMQTLAISGFRYLSNFQSKNLRCNIIPSMFFFFYWRHVWITDFEHIHPNSYRISQFLWYLINLKSR